ncbi:isocitrate lyase/PEP mutase family protein [Sphingobium aromaticivastans]|uniref:isocitrate lyase/PEP mutase family protein n=1 Tax=Sphingobium aromaticivastans TaxID=1778665 RepID=UPI003018E71D
MAQAIIRQKLERGEFFVAPGIQDMITAAIANHVGVDVVYGSGYWLTASAYGLPDAGIATFTQMLDRMATLVRTSNGAVMADADTGYGGLLNVHHTVRGYEEAGVTAIQLEDQEFPKKCGHTPFKRLVPVQDMVDKIKVACAARREADTLIIARTDARQSEGLDGALARADAYRAVGADILFVEALTSEEEMRIACDHVQAPMMANMSNGGLTPMRTAVEMQDIGYALAIFPAMTSLIGAAAMETALRRMKAEGSGEPTGMPIFDFKQFCSLIGFEDVWAFEKQWARD